MGLFSRIISSIFGPDLKAEAFFHEVLESGPVIVSTNYKFHKGEYAEQRTQPNGTRSGTTVIVHPKCPNPDRDYIPAPSRVGSRKHHRLNSYLTTVEQAVRAKLSPCYFCYGGIDVRKLNKALDSLEQKRNLAALARNVQADEDAEYKQLKFRRLGERSKDRNSNVVPDESQARETWE